MGSIALSCFFFMVVVALGADILDESQRYTDSAD